MIRLLPGAVPGFALRNRKWGKCKFCPTTTRVTNAPHIVLLNLAQLKPVKQNDNWENLVIPSRHRQIVQAMVETHTQDLGPSGRTRIGMDFVQGKGKWLEFWLKFPLTLLSHFQGRGCIILLHGVPGVGKTSTAGKPLTSASENTDKESYIRLQNASLPIPRSRFTLLHAVS